jgi:hypothetical protein
MCSKALEIHCKVNYEVSVLVSKDFLSLEGGGSCNYKGNFNLCEVRQCSTIHTLA